MLIIIIQAKTKEIIITWFTELFKAFQEELIDRQTDVFEQLINSLDFSEQNVRGYVDHYLCIARE